MTALPVLILCGVIAYVFRDQFMRGMLTIMPLFLL
jgi:hypothetical protein